MLKQHRTVRDDYSNNSGNPEFAVRATFEAYHLRPTRRCWALQSAQKRSKAIAGPNLRDIATSREALKPDKTR
eukprot:14905916-Alexandrium_andersonii.AAC.1